MKGDKYQISRQEAIKRLTRRYEEQCEQCPRMRTDVPLALYIKRNIRAVRVFNSECRTGLQDYAQG